MTWEETIIQIRKEPEYSLLVEQAYFDADLLLNLSRFKESEEFKETLDFLKHFKLPLKLLDIGSGNGISAVAFAQLGYEVHAVEPDPSNTVGAGAIRILKEQLQLDNLFVYESLAEDIAFDSQSFGVVYVRQAMHHAANLEKFVAECLRVLKPGGRLLTVRDHVIFDKKDKEWFLEMHPLHKFYGGENAYTPEEYKNAFAKAHGIVLKELSYYDSVINYAPETTSDIETKIKKFRESFKPQLKKRLGLLGSLPGMVSLYFLFLGNKNKDVLDERKVPGRMYTYIVTKS
jgi:SAM-dependent methyltransferase